MKINFNKICNFDELLIMLLIWFILLIMFIHLRTLLIMFAHMIHFLLMNLKVDTTDLDFFPDLHINTTFNFDSNAIADLSDVVCFCS